MRRNLPSETKVALATAYLFTDKTVSEIAKKYGLSSATVVKSYNKPEILREIARRSNKTYEDIVAIKREKTLPTKWKDEDVWTEYGISNKYNEMIPTEVQRKDKGWYARGLNKGWRRNFDFRSNRILWTERAWNEYGRSRGYDKLSPMEVKKIDSRWYSIGSEKKWKRSFNFRRKTRRGAWKTEEEWREYGLDRDYDKLGSGEVHDTDGGWWNKGSLMGWKENFKFQRKRNDGAWNTEEEWREYGIENGYNKMGVGGVISIDNSWYKIGRRRDWTKKFEFQRKHRKSWKDESEWREYGIENRYNNLGPGEVAKIDGGWISSGRRKRWIKNFEFQRLLRIGWKTEKEWVEYGIKMGFDRMSPGETEKADSSWYQIGNRNKWSYNFEFQRKMNDGLWDTKDEWIEYGIQHGYNKMNPLKIKDADGGWLGKGYKKGWNSDFPFSYRRMRSIKNLPKARQLSRMPFSSAELLTIISAIDEMSGYSREDIERSLRSVPRLNIGPLSLGTGSDGSYDAVSLAENLVHIAPEVYENDDVVRLVRKKLEQHYERLYPQSEYDPEEERRVVEYIKLDFERIRQGLENKDPQTP